MELLHVVGRRERQVLPGCAIGELGVRVREGEDQGLVIDSRELGENRGVARGVRCGRQRGEDLILQAILPVPDGICSGKGSAVGPLGACAQAPGPLRSVLAQFPRLCEGGTHGKVGIEPDETALTALARPLSVGHPVERPPQRATELADGFHDGHDVRVIRKALLHRRELALGDALGQERRLRVAGGCRGGWLTARWGGRLRYSRHGGASGCRGCGARRGSRGGCPAGSENAGAGAEGRNADKVPTSEGGVHGAVSFAKSSFARCREVFTRAQYCAWQCSPRLLLSLPLPGSGFPGDPSGVRREARPA